MSTYSEASTPPEAASGSGSWIDLEKSNVSGSSTHRESLRLMRWKYTTTSLPERLFSSALTCCRKVQSLILAALRSLDAASASLISFILSKDSRAFLFNLGSKSPIDQSVRSFLSTATKEARRLLASAATSSFCISLWRACKPRLSRAIQMVPPAATAETTSAIHSTSVGSPIARAMFSSRQTISYGVQSMRQQRSGMPGWLMLEDGTR